MPDFKPDSQPDPTPAAPPIAAIKQNMRSMWMAGDFGVIARTLAGDAATFAHNLHLSPGTRVLDVACGTGNVAIPLARMGCVVTGVDIAANLLEQARDRAAHEKLAISFDEGDAESLPYPDASFDAVVTMFGAMFAPRPELVAAELARVLRPGGRLAMANWTPAGFTGQMFRTGAKHVPPPPGLAPPVLWGDPATVRQRLDAAFEAIEATPVAVTFDLPVSPAGAVAFFRQYFGPTQTAFNRLDAAGQQAMQHDLEALWAQANTAADPARQCLIPNQYLLVQATRRS